MAYSENGWRPTELRSRLRTSWKRGVTLLRRGCFWIAIVLPMVYLPLAVVDHPLIGDFPTFLRMVAIHLGTVLLGMEYEAADGSSTDG